MAGEFTTTDGRKTEIHRIGAIGAEFDSVYDDILRPSFTRDELSDRSDLRAAIAAGSTLVWAAVDEQGMVLGAAVWEYEAEFGILLLAWLAARPGMRGRSVGGPLYQASLEQCLEAYDPQLVFAEVSDPRRHGGDELHGDPDARLRFYRRHGARTLDLPYFQPALGDGRGRIPDLLLMVLHSRPEQRGTAPDTLDATLLRSYLEAYQQCCEGAVGTDEQSMRLWRALDRPDGVPYRD